MIDCFIKASVKSFFYDRVGFSFFMYININNKLKNLYTVPYGLR